MKKLDTIDYAIAQTLYVHPDYASSLTNLLYHCCFSDEGINMRHFTSQNNARKLMTQVTQTDVLHFVLREAVKMHNAACHFYYNSETIRSKTNPDDKMNNIMAMFPFYGVCQKAVSIISNPKINAAVYYKTQPRELIPLINAIVDSRYLRPEKSRQYIDGYGESTTYISTQGYMDLFSKIQKDIDSIDKVTNVNINYGVVNRCLLDVMSGAQLKAQHSEYGLDGTLFATQDVGRRHNQEDSLVILVHPKNPQFKLLAVSDGMGGAELGEEASKYTIQELSNWFMSLPPDDYYLPESVQTKMNSKIALISRTLYERYNKDFKGIKAGATLVSAVITEDYTVTSTIGDSRIYSQKDNQLNLLTRDESYTWPPGKTPEQITARELNDLRFNRYSNVIQRCIGWDYDRKTIQSRIVENTSYDKLLLFSDGVTDLLSQEDILVISMSYPPEEITKMLVERAVNKTAIRSSGEDENHYAQVNAGKDNASAALYSRR